MNSDLLRRLMKAARKNPNTAEGRQSFADALGVDVRSVRRWLDGANIGEASLGLLYDYRPRDAVARAEVERFWQDEEARDTQEAKALADAKAREQATGEVADEAAGLLATVKHALEALALTVKHGLETLTGVVQGLSSRVDSQSAQASQERAQDRARAGDLGNGVQQLRTTAGDLGNGVQQLRTTADDLGNRVQQLQAKADDLGNGVQRLEAKADDLGNGVEQLQAKADDLGNAVQQLQAKADDLGNRVQKLQTKADDLGNRVQKLQTKADAHHRDSRIRFLALLGTVVAGFAAVIFTVVACTHSGVPVPGGHTRGGVLEEAAKLGRRGGGWGDQVDGSESGVEGSTGERKMGFPMPHQPLPGQAVAPCHGSARTLYGGCWFGTDATAPCPPDQFQEGQKCYVPIPAKPDAPVGKMPQPGQETPVWERPDAAGMPAKEEQ